MTQQQPSIAVNEFVTRQTRGSKFSHYEGELERVADMVQAAFGNAKPGYRDGVKLVPVPAAGFFSGVVEITPETKLRATFTARRPDEDPFVSVEALAGEKLPAEHVEVVIYHRDVLIEGGDKPSTDAEWEIVSINARPTPEPEPMTPMAMARNFLELPGGTKADYSAEDFARAILYWSCRANLAQVD